jgi:uncharacterized protein YkwD
MGLANSGVDPPRVGIRFASVLLPAAFVASLAVLALPAPAASSTSRGTVALSSLESGVLKDINKIRAQHHLAAVRVNARLTAASAQHSREMGAQGYFEHASHDGTAFWKRIDRWYAQGSFHYWSVGENLLWSASEVAPAVALQLWMNSPEHRANILTARWRDIGVSAVHVSDAPGTYKGLDVTIITTDFGTRH